jgi:hypothetical protein
VALKFHPSPRLTLFNIDPASPAHTQSHERNGRPSPRCHTSSWPFHWPLSSLDEEALQYFLPRRALYPFRVAPIYLPRFPCNPHPFHRSRPFLSPLRKLVPIQMDCHTAQGARARRGHHHGGMPRSKPYESAAHLNDTNARIRKGGSKRQRCQRT